MFSRKWNQGHSRMARNPKHGFTLIEMLIVIVIIGILAAALIPRLMSARGRANDTARKADLQQAATALISYQIDKGQFPTTGGALNSITTELTNAWMASIPADPNKGNTVVGILTWVAGQYMYAPITKNWFTNWWFVLMAQTESEGGSNFVYCAGDTKLNALSYEDIHTCTSFSTVGTCAGNTWACVYSATSGSLRYIYKY